MVAWNVAMLYLHLLAKLQKTDFNLRDTMESLAWPGFRTVVRKYWRAGMGEFHRSVSKTAFVKRCNLIPEIENEHLRPVGLVCAPRHVIGRAFA